MTNLRKEGSTGQAEQPAKPTPEDWMLHDMEFATVVTVRKPGRFIALCDGQANTREENLAHAELIIADHGAVAQRDRLVEALGLATQELISIRARDGAPQHIDWHRGQPIQTSSCTEEWWDELTEKCRAILDEARKP